MTDGHDRHDHHSDHSAGTGTDLHHAHGGHEHHGHGGHEHHSPEMFRDRFWLSLVLTLPILYFSEQIQIWFGYRAVEFPGSELVNPILGTILFIYGGRVFLQGARHELADRKPGMMTLISLAITVAYVYSMAVTLFGLPGMSFFWELGTLIVIMLLGHWLEMASVQGASRALDDLARLVPGVAHRLENGTVQDVPVEELQPGDSILVRPGEQLPADGLVADGNSSLNESFLTGESRPVPKEPGDEVVAGSVNGEGALTVTVARTGAETTLSQIQRLVEEAQSSRSRYQTIGDRAAGWLFYVALGVAVITFIAWFAATDLEQAITRTVTVLIIACPHALGLAIPLVIVNATAMAAKNGILVRNREAFERARNISFVAFDKTGTLTEGAFFVNTFAAEGVSEDEALGIMATLETRSEHPLGQAIVAEADRQGTAVPASENFEVIAGKGVRGSVNSATYTVGRPEWITEQDLELPQLLQASLEEAEGRGESVIVLMNSGRALAIAGLADRVRDSARATIRGLKDSSITPVMITGDAEAVARNVATELGIGRVHARVLPGEKAELVRELRTEAPTAFVGDGINDAPALLEADLGIAIGAGTNVAIESADLVLVNNDPRDVLAAIRLSSATYRKMIQNLWWAMGYNVLALPLAAGVLAWAGILLSPAVGAVLMSASTIVVAINAMLLRRTDLGN